MKKKKICITFILFIAVVLYIQYNSKNVQTNVQIKPAFVYKKPDMVLVRGGSFSMGSEKHGHDDEKPSHRVNIKDFFIGRYEVTINEFSLFVKDFDYVTVVEKTGVTWGFKNGRISLYTGYSWKNSGFPQDGDHPVVCISWYDAMEYCNWLSRVHGYKEYYKIDYEKTDKNNHCGFDHGKWFVSINEVADGYRLPTEAEWEYVAKAGENTRWSGCKDSALIQEYGNTADISSTLPEADRSINDGVEFTSRSGNYKPNSLGIHDMCGNVWEMCQDWYGADFYSKSPENKPLGPSAGEKRVIRGGGWDFDYSFATTTNRNGISPIHGSCAVGFRIARDAAE